MNLPIKNRRGTFRLAFPMLDNNLDDLRFVFSRMVVIHAEAKYDRQEIEYVAYSDLFDEIPPDEKAPEYNIDIRRNRDGNVASVSATRIEHASFEVLFRSSCGKTTLPMWVLINAWQELERKKKANL